MSTAPRSRRDAGFTLPELLITIVITSLVVGVLAMTIVVSFRTIPDVTRRADSSVAVQGITTWLPPDVDSARPGAFDADPTRASGCAGGDVGVNLLRLEWDETLAGLTTTYVAAYRFHVDGSVGRIVRVACQGIASLGSGSELSMSAQLSPTPPTVILSDADGDGREDQVRFQIETLSGEVVHIDAATKNPNETLPPKSTNPPTSAAVNQPPVATAMDVTLNPDIATTFDLSATDPNGDVLTATLESVPSGWSTSVSGLTVTLTPLGAGPGEYVIEFEVTDPSGSSAEAVIRVTITTSTTSTSSTSSTLPPCVISAVSVTPSSVRLQNKNVGKLKTDVSVVATVSGGYCIGLTLQYDTGAPNGQHVQNLGDAAPYDVTLLGQPHGTELWSTGTKLLEIRDGANNLVAQANLVVTN